MKSTNKLSGIFTALVTPFKNGELDKASFIKLLHQQLTSGVDGFVINGTTGESPTLKVNEVKQLVDWAKVEVSNKVPIIIGAGTNSTAKTIDLVNEFSSCKPHSFLIVVPYYNRPPQRGLVAHFNKIADAATAPIVLYNVPSRTVAKLELESTVELAKHKNIIALKEASGDLEFFKRLKQSLPNDFSLLSGDDGSCVDFINAGGDGVISVWSHLIGRELKEAIALNTPEFSKKYSELLKYVYIEANPIPVKMAMHWMGVLDSPELRLPLIELDQKYHEGFKRCLKDLKKI